VNYVFQEPGAALNPVFRVGQQIMESLRLHQPEHATEAEVIRLLKVVGIPAPEVRARSYPHQMSGGMQQRIMIAMAIATRPRLLIADEPTTALDVTIQAQILQLLRDLQRQLGMAVLLITHNLKIVQEVAGYGMQLDAIEEMITLLVQFMPKQKLSKEQKQTLAMFETMMSEIAAKKEQMILEKLSAGGVDNVHSGSERTATDGTRYADWK
jgi:ABC-type microcin C transport system duplicated ATPase subunit YejF